MEPLDREGHLRRRKEYQEVIDSLDKDLHASSDACENIAIQLEDAVLQLSGNNASTVDNLAVLSPIQTRINEELDIVHGTLIDTINEIQTAGTLLMQNDRQIERYQNELNVINGSLHDLRHRYHSSVEHYELTVRKLKDRETKLKEQLSTERGITERRTKEVKRLETETNKLNKRLQEHHTLTNPKDFVNIFNNIRYLKTKFTTNGNRNDKITIDFEQNQKIVEVIENIERQVTRKMEEFDLAQASEHELRFRANEASRQLEDSKMRREFDKANWKKKNELLKNGFEHEKSLIENRHNEELEKLQDENQLLRATNGNSTVSVFLEFSFFFFF